MSALGDAPAIGSGDVGESFRPRDHAVVNALWVGAQFQDAALLSILVPALVLHMAPRTHTLVLATLSTLAAAVGILVPPFAGALSDRARRNGGDRRIQTGILLAIDAAALVAMSETNTIGTLATTLIVAVAAMNAAATIYQVLLPETVPRQAWGTAAAVRGVMTLVGTIAGLAVAAFLLPRTALFAAAALIVLSALTLFAVPRPYLVKPSSHALVRDRRDLRITLIARAWMVLGTTLLNTYVLYFFSDVLGVRNASLNTGLVGGAALVGAMVSTVLAAALSGRIERRVLVALSGLPMVVAALGFALAPDVRFIFVYAALFGLGYGGVFSSGWALALEAIPEIGDVARDLGIWGTLSNAPALVAPMLGAAIIAHGATPSDGFRGLFAAAGISFALGSLTVLRVGRRPLGSTLGRVMLVVICLVRIPWLGMRLRIRQWGRLPFRRGATILIANHQCEDESEVVVWRAFAQGPWNAPVFTASSRRMFERGFMAARLPVTAPLTRHLNCGAFFLALGLNPLENQLASRPLDSLAREVRSAHGNLALTEVFRPEALRALLGRAQRLSDLDRAALFADGQAMVKLSHLREPYRREAMSALRAGVSRDIAWIVDLVRRGGTFYVTPEGFYSTDGRLQPLKGIVEKVVPLGEVWFAAIAFDPFRGSKLSMLYRVVRPLDIDRLSTSLAAARPVTTSALVAAYLHQSPERVERGAAVQAVRAARAGLPDLAFVDPEFDTAPERAAGEVLQTLVTRGVLRADADGYTRAGPCRDPHFPDVADMLAFQATFFEETARALRELRALPR